MNFFDKMDSFCLIGYSFGSIVALKLVKELESRGKTGRLLLIDGSPTFVKSFFETEEHFELSEEYAENLVIKLTMASVSLEKNDSLAQKAFLHKNWEDKMKELRKVSNESLVYSENYYGKYLTAFKNRLHIMMNFDLNEIETLESTSISLFRCSQVSAKTIVEDYGLSRYSLKKINVKIVEGDHSTILKNPELAKLINETIFVAS